MCTTDPKNLHFVEISIPYFFIHFASIIRYFLCALQNKTWHSAALKIKFNTAGDMIRPAPWDLFEHPCSTRAQPVQKKTLHIV